MAEVKISADSGGGSVALKGPASTTGNAAVSLTLPQNDGDANQLLQTNGSGSLSWVASAVGGKLLQVVSASSNTDNVTPSANQTWTDMAPTCSITPSATNSKIIIVLSCMCISNTIANVGFRLLRGSTAIRDWHGYSSVVWNSFQGPTMHIDTTHNTTSEITYKYQTYANQNYSWFLWNYQGITASNSLRNAEIYLFEVAA